MSFSPINSAYLVRTISTSEILRLGSAKVVTSGGLGYIRVGLFIFNQSAKGGSEKIRTNIYSDSTYTSLVCSSSWTNLDIVTIPLLASSHSWIGVVRTDFAKQQINSQLTYYIAVELQNYTYTLGTFWVGGFKDYPSPTYSTAVLASTATYKYEIFTYTPRVVSA